MPLVKAVCTNCGANLEVDNSKDAAICPMCGTPYIVEKAIQKYNTYNSSTDVNAINEAGFRKLLDAANGFMTLNDYNKAKSVFEKITQEYPQKFEGWWGVVQTVILLEKQHPIGEYVDLDCGKFFIDKARKLASNSQIQMIESLEKDYIAFAQKHNKETKESIDKHQYNLRSSFFDKFQNVNDLYNYLMTNRMSICDAISWNWKIIPSKDGKLVFKKYVKTEMDGITHNTYNYYIESWDRQTGEFRFSSIGDVEIEKIGRGFKIYTVNERISVDSRLFLIEYNEQGLKETKSYWVTSPETKQYAFSFSSKNANSPLILMKEENDREVVSSTGCYIATCVYGSYDCPQVWALRRYRDFYLQKSIIGRAFIHCYYAISPKLVKLFGNQKWFHTIWKGYLDKKVEALKNAGYEDTPYED